MTAASTRSHAEELTRARAKADDAERRAAEREAELHKVIDGFRCDLEKRGRENANLKALLDAEIASKSVARAQPVAAAAADAAAAAEESAASSGRAQREIELEEQIATLSRELKYERDETSRLREKLEGAKLERDRLEISSERSRASLQSERDVMAQRLAAAMESPTAPRSGPQSTTSRRGGRAARARARGGGLTEQQVEALKAQVKDGAEAAAGLQELLVQQQKVAEGYRGGRSDHLRSSLSSRRRPHLQQALHSYHEHERAEREKLATQLAQQQSQLQRALTFARRSAPSWSEYKNGLELAQSHEQGRGSSICRGSP